MIFTKKKFYLLALSCALAGIGGGLINGARIYDLGEVIYNLGSVFVWASGYVASLIGRK